MRSIWNSIADYIRECDKLLLFLVLAASGYGCIAVWSATNYIGPRQVIVQSVALLIGLVALIVLSHFDYNLYKKDDLNIFVFFEGFTKEEINSFKNSIK